ncbi:MAG: MFS transporter [Chloroflexi bacterium]|nr:MFS transporter [Chloroflexota bacterium]
MTALDPGTLRAYSANVRRFYLYKFFLEFQLWFPIWVVYLQQKRGLSLTQVTTVDIAFWMVIVLAEMPTGAVADRWGRKVSLLLGALGFATAVLLFGLAPSFWWILGTYLVWGVSMTLASGADAAFLYDSLAALGREGEFTRAIGRARAFGIGAGLVGGLIGAPLAAATDLSVPILISAGLGLIAAVIVLTFREPAHHGADAAPPRLHYFQVMGEALRHTWHSPPLRSMVALNAVLLSAGMVGFIFFQPFLVDAGVPLGNFGVLDVPVRLASVAGSLVAYRLARRLGERSLLFAVTAGFSGALLVLAAAPALVAVSMFALLNFQFATVGPVTSEYVNRHAPQHLRATVASVANMANSVVFAVAEPGLGVIADHAGLRTSFFVGGVSVGVLGAMALVMWLWMSRGEASGQSTPEPVVAAGD